MNIPVWDITKKLWGNPGWYHDVLVIYQPGDMVWELGGSFLSVQPVYWLRKSVRKTVMGKFQICQENMIVVSWVGTHNENPGCT
jgi:hypothetical protein